MPACGMIYMQGLVCIEYNIHDMFVEVNIMTDVVELLRVIHTTAHETASHHAVISTVPEISTL